MCISRTRGEGEVGGWESTYPDLDAGAGGGTQPVSVGAEAQGVDDVTSVQRVQVLAFI